MQSSTFNLIDVFTVVKSKWKTIFTIVLVTLLVATAIVFTIPKKYRAQTLAIAQNALMADKAKLFNSNIQGLYSIIGDEDDLDVIFSLSKLDVVFSKLVNEFNLINYYNVDGKNHDIKNKKALLILKANTDIVKNEKNILRITVYDKDPFFAAKLANRTTELIRFLQEEIWRKSYESIYYYLNASIVRMEKQVIVISDTIQSIPTENARKLLLINKRQSLLDEIQKYGKEAVEFQLMIDATPQALVVLDKAFPSSAYIKPDKLLVLSIVLFVALFFSILFVLFIERRKN
jgi:capsular polysaccharide biosynthesis protein